MPLTSFLDRLLFFVPMVMNFALFIPIVKVLSGSVEVCGLLS